MPNAQKRATRAVGYKKITLGHMKIRIPGPCCGPEDTGVEDEVADFASVDMTGTLRAEKPSQNSYSPIASHRHTQNVCQMTGRSHPNAPATGGKVPKFLGKVKPALTSMVKSRAPNTIKLFAPEPEPSRASHPKFAAIPVRTPPQDTPTQVHSTFEQNPQIVLFVDFFANGQIMRLHIVLE